MSPGQGHCSLYGIWKNFVHRTSNIQHSLSCQSLVKVKQSPDIYLSSETLRLWKHSELLLFLAYWKPLPHKLVPNSLPKIDLPRDTVVRTVPWKDLHHKNRYRSDNVFFATDNAEGIWLKRYWIVKFVSACLRPKNNQPTQHFEFAVSLVVADTHTSCF